MTARRRSLGLALAAVAPLACATHTGVTHQVLSGPYRGQTAEGQPVVVTFAETEQAFRGTGSIADQPIVLAGAVGWRGVATLARSDGSRTSVRLELSADGEQLVLKPAGSKPITLTRGGTATTNPAGPFSGTQRAQRGRALLARATLVQHGALVTGVAIVAGDAAGVSGRATGASTSAGVVTFLDGSQVDFDAELSADRRTLKRRGFGQPVVLNRQGSP